MLSCMIACTMRSTGVSEDGCLGHCDRHGQSGCRLTVNEETFKLCGPRDIRGSECAGAVSRSDCELGCHSYPQVQSRYERREMPCPNDNLIANPGRLSTFEDCQAICDDRDDCGAIQINTRSRHPANNCLLYSNECNENREDLPCTSISECFYFERVFEATTCTLSGGEHVFDGWSGNDSGENSSNTCSCESGTLMCTGTTAEIWTAISESLACEANDEGIWRTFGEGGFNLVTCKARCLETAGCKAIDYYRESGWCNLYDNACSTPRSSHAGASSWSVRINHVRARLVYTLDADRDTRFQRCSNALFVGAGETGKTMLECQESCDGHESCKGIFGVFNIDQSRTLKGNGACYLCTSYDTDHTQTWPTDLLWNERINQQVEEIEWQQGNCRGSEVWESTGQQWNCVHPRFGHQTRAECAQRCLDEPGCASFDTDVNPIDDTTKGTCCLFKAGASGNGSNSRICYYPKLRR